MAEFRCGACGEVKPYDTRADCNTSRGAPVGACCEVDVMLRRAEDGELPQRGEFTFRTPENATKFQDEAAVCGYLVVLAPNGRTAVYMVKED